MALSSFGRGRDGSIDSPTPTPSSSSKAATPAPSSAPGGLSAFIDQGSEFEGKLSFKDTVRIDGRFKGEISSDNTLIVGETGEIEAAIHSHSVVVSGNVTGDIFACERVVLHKTASVAGNIETPSLMVEEGASLNGQVKMTGRGSQSSGAPLKSIPGGGNGSKESSKEAPKAEGSKDEKSKG
jgi:cytoskeletal protein CcmA (bactofilin family)